MKIIDILNKISRNEFPNKTKFKVYTDRCRHKFLCEYEKDYPGTIWCITENGKFNYKIDFMRILNYEVEVIAESKEIEEFKTEYTMRNMDMQFQNKINEIIRAVNKLNKEREGK